MDKYDHKTIEAKWQDFWEKEKIYQASDSSKKPKKYVLVEFPYPSGEGLHMGHLRPYTAGDTFSRYWRMKGFEVLYPIGWDAFGLPAENYAIKNKVHPRVSTAKNVENAKRQLKSWGMSFDWSREVNTTDPGYYKWTQWIFLQLFKAGLAYEATGLINWCPKDKTGLANEEVIDGKCERCGTPVEKKELRQWYLKITAYAEKLLEGLKSLKEWPEPVKLQQENWIGKNEGAELEFRIRNYELGIRVFTTRPDTLFGATYMVLAPEHPLITDIKNQISNIKEVEEYTENTKKKSDIQRTAVEKEKTGVELKGIKAINPATKEEIPVWVADYVLMGYGTGAIMAVPAHDERDFEFAKKYRLPIRTVINNPSALPNASASPLILRGDETAEEPPLNIRGDSLPHSLPRAGEGELYTGEGVLMNSGKFDGMDSEQVKAEITKFVGGQKKTQYKLRDWVFSRQRYWVEPIPLVHCEKCGIVPVPEDELPVTLPEVKDYEPTGTGESPLAAIVSWVNVKCPNCGGKAKRETNTMPQWAGSSWYWLRYTDPQNDKEMASKKLVKQWTPVDVYFGGMEHTTLHLLYSRFWNLFLYDQGYVTAQEPYTKRVPHGIVLASDGEKMSKSRGNVVNPDDVIEKFGADTLRMYEMFLGPHGDTVFWNDKGIVGVKRFLDKVWRSAVSNYPSPSGGGWSKVGRGLHALIKKITADLEAFKFNTCISAFMEFLNKNENMAQADFEVFLRLLAPFAPHTTEELWHQLGYRDSIHQQLWPEFNEKLAQDTKITFVVQVSGKLRATLEMPTGSSQAEVKAKVVSDKNVKKYLADKEVVKEIFVPDKLINFVLR
ncbi:MAG: leucine--tRNA ligase [Candidatus Doudnabacteria bacterium RIFCSPLOWO2_02_FULL_48_8]|nr:MAG: leucine--tRNA ligase [Candidatus Doudnabacteria bacterium RIFCSPLOWO2_02_FULL_48_8]